MKVSVTQTGGPLGVPMSTALDTADLSEAEAADLAARAGAAVRAPAPEPERRFPAQLGYTVHVEPDDGPPVERSYVEGAMPADVAGLVRYVQDHPSSRA